MDVPAAKKGQQGATTDLSPEEIKLLESYDEAWPRRLRGGFKKDNAFFAWLMIATRPHDEWPDWCRDYLVEVAARLVSMVSSGDSYHANSPHFDFDDYRKVFVLLGIDTAAKKWEQAEHFWVEYELSFEDPVYEAGLWRDGIQFSQRDLILHDDTVTEIKKYIRRRAEEEKDSRLNVAASVAKEGVEIDMSRGEVEYETPGSMLRAMRLRRQAIVNKMVEHGPEACSPRKKRR